MEDKGYLNEDESGQPDSDNQEKAGTPAMINNESPTPINDIQMAKEGYINGSDLLLKVGNKCIGHCTSHTLTYNSETKDRAVKPAESEDVQAGLWKQKGVTGLSVSISFEGLRFYNETENGYDEIAAQWGEGQSVEVSCFRRKEDSKPYFKGKCVIDSLEETTPANDDASYSGQLSNDGEPEVYPGKQPAA